MAWPGEVIYQKGNAVFIHSNRDVKKVAACKVKPYELKERKEENKEGKRDEDAWNKMIEEDERKENNEINEEKEDKQEVEIEETIGKDIQVGKDKEGKKIGERVEKER